MFEISKSIVTALTFENILKVQIFIQGLYVFFN